jgi:hypothetical protein
MAARSTAFGLDVESELPLALLDASAARATARTLAVSLRPGARCSWPAPDELLCEDRQADGSLIYEVRAHHHAGYLIAGPHYGAHMLSTDGRLLVCDPEGLPDASWQRLLIAQVLPFAAVLQGLEVFHASAVVLDGQAVAFVGPSRAGKTSVALELCRRGAGFLADDVLALEPRAGALVGHPGSPLAGLDRAEAERAPDGLAAAEILGENSRELLVRTQAAAAPAPLGALFFLERRADGPAQPRFEPLADAGALLGATFNFILASPRRLLGLLDVCALAAQRRVERVLAGPAVDAAQLGAAVTRRLQEEAA